MYGSKINKKNKKNCAPLCRSSAAVRSYLVVLVGRDRDEGGLGENVRAEGRVFGAEAVVLVGLDDVDPRLVLVHGV